MKVKGSDMELLLALLVVIGVPVGTAIGSLLGMLMAFALGVGFLIVTLGGARGIGEVLLPLGAIAGGISAGIFIALSGSGWLGLKLGVETTGYILLSGQVLGGLLALPVLYWFVVNYERIMTKIMD